eukprot:CAMPEP_0170510612 /NCGR_PEP_ID=MMETSP0208-20121228/65861_1 /TAXON_ID=197538 /ORGANISM="Strombidium inclinatum, Strain S3" /LENGTH=237 /DNA_ID=CAMNT_0010794091 /DNA_START=54 /DNA_END=767 /DNA_ORIENTATION=-
MVTVDRPMVINSPRYPAQSKPPLGAVRLCDGVYLGDVYASKDSNFVFANKITHVINCAGKEIENEEHTLMKDHFGLKGFTGIKFLTFYWLDDDRQLIFDEEDRVPIEIVKFVDEALDQGTSVLIHSMRGQSRASVVGILYFMESFQWDLLKTLEYINSRRPDLEIRANFLQQLQQYTKRKQIPGSKRRLQRSDEWQQTMLSLPMYAKGLREVPVEELFFLKSKASQEILIRNTFLNS